MVTSQSESQPRNSSPKSVRPGRRSRSRTLAIGEHVWRFTFSFGDSRWTWRLANSLGEWRSLWRMALDFGEWRTALANGVHFGALRAYVNRQSVRKSPTLFIERQSSARFGSVGPSMQVWRFTFNFGGWRTTLANDVHFGALRAHVNRQSVRIPPTLFVERQSSARFGPTWTVGAQPWRFPFNLAFGEHVWRFTFNFGGWRTALANDVHFGALRAHVNRQTVRKSPTLFVERQSSARPSIPRAGTASNPLSRTGRIGDNGSTTDAAAQSKHQRTTIRSRRTKPIPFEFAITRSPNSKLPKGS